MSTSSIKKLTELGQGVEGIVVKTKLDEGEENRLADLANKIYVH